MWDLTILLVRSTCSTSLCSRHLVGFFVGTPYAALVKQPGDVHRLLTTSNWPFSLRGRLSGRMLGLLLVVLLLMVLLQPLLVIVCDVLVVLVAPIAFVAVIVPHMVVFQCVLWLSW